jgi:protein SCO1/2
MEKPIKQRDQLRFRHVPVPRGEHRVAFTLCVVLLVLGILKFANAAHDVSEAASRKSCCTTNSPNQWCGSALALKDIVWESDKGAKIRFSDLQGHPQVVSLFYSDCHITCPMTLLSMKQVEAALPPELRSQVGFVLITFMPEFDSARVLHRFRGVENLSDRWALLRGSKKSTRLMANLLGVSFNVESYRLTHSPQIAVLDAEGRIVYRQSNLQSDPKAIVDAVRSALAMKIAKGS